MTISFSPIVRSASHRGAPSSRSVRPARARWALATSLLLLGLSACGGRRITRTYDEFIAHFPDEGPGGGSPPVVPVPPPSFPVTPIWNPAAVSLARTAQFGSFPSDVVAYGSTIFLSDADAIEAAGADIIPFDTGGVVPTPSSSYARVHIRASDLVDDQGRPGDAAHPIGFGYFLNDLAIATDHLGFVLANAGGSDSIPACANVVVFDPTTGALRQTVNLAIPFSVTNGLPPLLDSTGAVVPGQQFVQTGAEGVAFVPTGVTKGLLFVAMANFIVGPPSFGAIKYPGTVEVFDVDTTLAAPMSRRPSGGIATETILTLGYNPAAVTPIAASDGTVRLLVTTAGTTGYDASFQLVPQTPAAVEVFDVASRSRLGVFDLGLAGLSAARPALGMDAAGHHIAALASSVRGEVYLLHTDGLYTASVDANQIAVLRGPKNGIAIDPAAAGSPGGNVAGLAISPDCRTLVASGFGDLFAFPSPTPGRLYVLSLPEDVVGSLFFQTTFVPGTVRLVTQTGATLGPVVILPSTYGNPEVFTAVSGTLDPTTFLGTGPAFVGTLTTFGSIR